MVLLVIVSSFLSYTHCTLVAPLMLLMKFEIFINNKKCVTAIPFQCLEERGEYKGSEDLALSSSAIKVLSPRWIKI